MKTCPKCSLTHDDSVMKCTYCGYEFEQSAPEAAVNEPAAPQQNTVPPAGYGNTPNNNYQYNAYQSYAPYGAPQVKYCPHCGNQCDPNAIMCVKCGSPFVQPTPTYNDKPSTGLKILSFFIPIAGLILYLTGNKEHPNSSKSYGKMALIGFIIHFVLLLLYYLFFLIIIPLFIFDSGTPDYSYGWEDDFYYSFINILYMFK